eukprot:CAMPEP_0183312930 /NCGR_PEP_ID=MMETSP0160_2-20130417/43522_1 /TAXON_ID=2839 ORGANISM="Odontella Sinensis, Strain Grunow 1884" /NCGR_SAMPLE_ID=MMETSP0160_2 /ASSEMBLY_ACC=CAM_ASM_000250 /LENGTH=240 /DNA_ID=CAMNT_0025477891 /DNA_START=65 /DNA_END=787 /DNA_ORIENTATION=-
MCGAEELIEQKCQCPPEQRKAASQTIVCSIKHPQLCGSDDQKAEPKSGLDPSPMSKDAEDEIQKDKAPLLSSSQSGDSVPDGEESESDSDSDSDDDGGDNCSQMSCLKKSPQAVAIMARLGYSPAPSGEGEEGGKAKQPSAPGVSARRRIHAKKSTSASLSVSFSELVSVKEITRYSCADVSDCFYTAEELKTFRSDYILGINGPDDDIIEVMQEVFENACDYLLTVPRSLCGLMSTAPC